MFRKDKTPKQYRHPMMRSIHGERLLVHMKIFEDGTYETSEYWVKLNEASILAIGYTKAIDYKTDFKDLWTQTYMKIDGLKTYPCMRTDAITGEELGEVVSKETASTLYDYFKSTAEQEFCDSLKTRSMSSMSSKQLIFYGVIGIGVVIGAFLLTMG